MLCKDFDDHGVHSAPSIFDLNGYIFDLDFGIQSFERLGAGAGGGGVGEETRSRNEKNDVLTTCKAVTQRGGQRIITVFFPQ